MHAWDVIAAATVAVAVREILKANKARADRREGRDAVRTWETEGGAVPVSRSATTAQVSPAPDDVPF